jgi:hypothetical protein
LRKHQLPPVKERLIDERGFIQPAWARWFQTFSVVADAAKRTPDLAYSSDVSLSTRDYGKLILFDCSSGDLVCTLPPVNSQDVNGWLTVFRIGSNRLTLVPAESSSRVEYGSYGGRVWNEETKRAAANLTLQLISLTQWGITGSTGIWYVR